ncbi:MAG: DNA polymerase II large subunit [Candidatus Micrarchaeia archaeon]
MVEASEEMKKYFSSLTEGLDSAMSVAQQARSRGFDPSSSVEITPATDVAGRVEGLLGPPGISKVIRELEHTGMPRDMIAYEIVKKIVAGEVVDKPVDQLIDVAVRVGVGILTEGVLVAPTEGISKILVRKDPDGSRYLAIYFSGPIRSAGGTVAAQAVVLADVARRAANIPDYRPTEDEIKRYEEEVALYDDKCHHLQYRPPMDDVRAIVSNCPVCIDGDPTEEIEIGVKRNLPRVETNRVRGGIALVICEGIAQKSAKVLKYTRKIKLDWNWLESIIKVSKKDSSGELKPLWGYLDEMVAGRPVFSYPSRKGGFRLRYGRTRSSGIMGKAIHPATMYLLDEFVAIGTQLKVERPGKGCIVVPCDSIDPPVVRLLGGNVVRVESSAQAKELAGKVEEIIFLGDMLVTLGDFLKSNHPLVKPAWCHEYFEELCKKQGVPSRQPLSFEEAYKFSKETGVPLHPKYTFNYTDLDRDSLLELALWLSTGRFEYELPNIFKPKKFSVEASGAKKHLENILCPHIVDKGSIVIAPDDAMAILSAFGMLKQGANAQPDPGDFKAAMESAPRDGFDMPAFLSSRCGVPIKAKSPTYIGSRMARPEKAKARDMKVRVHVLFPIGHNEKNRNLLNLYEKMKSGDSREGKGITVEVAHLVCPSCNQPSIYNTCPSCNVRTVNLAYCSQCGTFTKSAECPKCLKPTSYGTKKIINLIDTFEVARKRVGSVSDSIADSALSGAESKKSGFEIKAVQGLISRGKIPEPLEKGILRAKHGVAIFRDGTCRFDATDVPLTHFIPDEVEITVEQARSLGYVRDYLGKPLESGSQILELKPQDIILSHSGAEFFIKVASFVDDELVSLYGLPPYYNVKDKAGLVGKLTIGLSPHTSAGVLSRIVGFTKAHVGFAHPYFHTAKRRNCDGDEDSVSLLLDSLINFSKEFVPATRGGTMDAPLVMTTILDPSEVDDEVHSMEIASSYDSAFYAACERGASPSEAQVPLVKGVLGKPAQYEGLFFTHHQSRIDDGVISTSYIRFKDMEKKVVAQMDLESKIRAVDPPDVAGRVLNSHFLPDIYGNLRKFSHQGFRCISCNASYRRVPMLGKCTRCHGKLVLTIHKGGIEKYLDLSMKIATDYGLPPYVKQRLELVKKDLQSIFVDEKSKQFGLSDFM